VSLSFGDTSWIEKKMTCFRCGKKFDKYTGKHLSNNSNLCLDFKFPD